MLRLPTTSGYKVPKPNLWAGTQILLLQTMKTGHCAHTLSVSAHIKKKLKLELALDGRGKRKCVNELHCFFFSIDTAVAQKCNYSHADKKRFCGNFFVGMLCQSESVIRYFSSKSMLTRKEKNKNIYANIFLGTDTN